MVASQHRGLSVLPGIKGAPQQGSWSQLGGGGGRVGQEQMSGRQPTGDTPFRVENLVLGTLLTPESQQE